jgi:hypothetical protein
MIAAQCSTPTRSSTNASYDGDDDGNLLSLLGSPGVRPAGDSGCLLSGGGDS